MTDLPPRILMVEDDADFALLARHALSRAEVAASLDVVGNGEEAVSYLERAKVEPPALVLLDLKLPKLSGVDVLRWIRAEGNFQNLRVVVLTSSGQDCDREEVAKLGAADYRVKPAGFRELVALMREIADRWGLSLKQSLQ